MYNKGLSTIQGFWGDVGFQHKYEEKKGEKKLQSEQKGRDCTKKRK